MSIRYLSIPGIIWQCAVWARGSLWADNNIRQNISDVAVGSIHDNKPEIPKFDIPPIPIWVRVGMQGNYGNWRRLSQTSGLRSRTSELWPRAILGDRGARLFWQGVVSQCIPFSNMSNLHVFIVAMMWNGFWVFQHLEKNAFIVFTPPLSALKK